MKVALIQTNPQENVSENLAQVENFVKEATQNGAQLVMLPEMFSYMGTEKQRIQTADSLNSGVFLLLQKLAQKENVYLVAGSHSEKANATHVHNTMVVFSPEGHNLSTYRKIHLFNLKDAEGNPLYCESDVFLAGKSRESWKLNFNNKSYNCLSTICYDLRFPEIFRSNKNEEPFDFIFLPAAFTHQTGIDHWEVLIRARAIENQCFVIACNQTGTFANGSKRNYGHSIVVDPWGKVLLQADESVGIFYCEIDFEVLSQVRKRLPALADRKL